MENTPVRIVSIDIFRALTMLLMIFVNDLWTLTGIPHWLEHAEITENMLGLADVVFPCFLFIVGMSIPFAINARIAKADSKTLIINHIFLRSLALIVMGIFTVNVPALNAQATGLRSEWFQIIMVIAFFLIWNVYPKAKGKEKYIYRGLEIAGIIILVWLAFIYKGNQHGSDEIFGMRTQWWGILGLIGWTYLVASLSYLFLKSKPGILLAIWILFMVFNIVATAGWFKMVSQSIPDKLFIGNGAFHAFAFAGIVASISLKNFFDPGNMKKLGFYLLAISFFMFILGLITNHFWNISKLGETPPWIFYCCAIAFAFFALLHWLVDIKNKAGWFEIVKPAGTSTLTCYLIPYWYYSFMDLYGIELPAWMKDGGIGIIKSIIYSFVIIGITFLLGKMKIKLRI